MNEVLLYTGSMQKIKDSTVRKISRTEAESLMASLEVISTDVLQDNDEMKIMMIFSDERKFLMRYNFSDHNKSYYLCNP